MKPLPARLFAVACALILAACGTSPPKPPPGPPPKTSADRIDAIAGGVLIVPLDAVPPKEISAGMQVRLDDQRVLPSHLCRIGVTMSVPGPNGIEPDRWLPAPGNWTAKEILPENDIFKGGVAVIVVTPPTDGVGQGVWIGGVRHNVNWLPAPAALVRGGGDDPWRPVAARVDARLLEAIRPESRSPLTRWRYRLVVDGLRPGGAENPAPGSAVGEFDDSVIESLARQNEDRWRVAIAWLWAADPAVCERLKQRLAALVDFGEGRLAPAWPTDHQSMDQLLEDLLDPGVKPQRRVQLAEAWLDSQSPGVAWVIDDGGNPGRGTENDANVVRVGIANLMDRETLCWIDEGAQGSPNLRPLPSMGVTQLLFPVVSQRSAAKVIAHAGKFAAPLVVQARPTPALPPGVGVGPLFEDYTMTSWTRGEETRPKIEWSTTAMLHRPAKADATRTPWELYVECRLLPGIGSLDRECVRVHLGESGKPSRVMRVNMNGEVVVEEPAHEAGGTPGKIRVLRRDGGWSFRLPLPGHIVEADGTIRIGVTRTDALGRRTAWPRAMLPWQEEPARALVDTTTWNVSQGTLGPGAR